MTFISALELAWELALESQALRETSMQKAFLS